MNTLATKYKNLCKFCHNTLDSDSIALETLSDIKTIEKLLGPRLIENNERHAKIRKNEICSKCSSTVLNFIAFRKECLAKEEIFREDFAIAEKYEAKAQELLRKNDAKIDENDAEMDVDESSRENLEVEENNNAQSSSSPFVCDDCDRKFGPDQKSMFLSHCRNVHPKKVPCPFGCLAIKIGEQNHIGPRKQKIFRNLHFLAKHIQTQHLMIKSEIFETRSE